MKEIKIEPIKTNEKWFIETQRQVDKMYEKTIDYGRTQFVNKIVELEEQLEMVKSLYQNEKDHTDTLKRIIKKIEVYIKSQEYFYDDGEESGFDCEIDGYKILNLLKEIK